jgi:phosphatidylserine/phosphatidylglycerophosphate/cardiolipin synthase-like enzyme
MANTGKIIALHNNDIVFLAWRYDQEIPNCLGFTVRRKDLNQAGSDFQALPAWVGWQGGSNENWVAKTTDVWPVQKFNWRDFTSRAGGKYQYQVIPMVGSPDSLKPEEDLLLTTEEVDLTPDTANNVQAYFNNGILSTQHVAHMLPPGSGGAPSSGELMKHIKTPGDQLRSQLAGQIIEGVKSLLLRAQSEGGDCYCALYELDDPELIDAILKTGKRVHVILSATPTNDPPKGGGSRQTLHQAGIDITDRMLPPQDIGHNKSVVYVNASGTPTAVLAGSTNWTTTGLCAQSNNSVIIEDETIAGFYMDYWNRLKKDTQAAGADPKQLQGATFRTSNSRPNAAGQTNVWYSPNTKQKSKPKTAAVPDDLSATASCPAGTPGDMFEVFQAIHGAQQAVLFLEFMPGTPSVLDVIKDVEVSNPKLFIRGAATDPKAMEKFDDKQPIQTELYHRSATGDPDTVDETGVAATAINDQFSYWKKELLKSSTTAHAIIHDKIVVVDPMSDTGCVVVTGSHNQGYKASYANDENLVIFRGNRPLALAYTTHIMDVYDHYRWRFQIQQKKQQAWTGLVTTPEWQDRYFQPGSTAYQELDFWLSAPSETSAAGEAPSTPSAAKTSSGGVPKRVSRPKKAMAAAAGAHGTGAAHKRASEKAHQPAHKKTTTHKPKR